MRGQKLSISEELRRSEQHFPRVSEEDEQEEEVQEMLAEREREKRISYNESKKRFHEERAARKEFSSKVSKPKKNKQRHSQKNPLGIPVGDYIYHGPGVLGLPSIFGRPYQEEKKEEYKIVRSKGKAYRFEKTLCSHIFRILLKRGRPLHVNDIILALQKSGVLKDTNNHTYSVVYRTLTREHAIFERSETEKATFCLRQGFVSQEKPAKVERVIEVSEEFSSLQELVIDAYAQLAPVGGCCPSDVYQLLKSLGFNGPYKSIYEAMQSTNFRRIGFAYHLTANGQE